MLSGLRPEIGGRVAPGFEPVRRVLAQNFLRGERGAAVAVWHRGELVVDLWAGVADVESGRRFTGDTLATVFSCTKGLVALAFLMLADRGRLDYDAPLAEYWPELGRGTKRAISVRMLLNHRAGLVGLSQPLGLDDLEHRPERVSAVLEAQEPFWAPDTDQGYHGVTYGLYAAELFRRLTGESLGSFIRREIAEPLGADVFLGLPASHEPRVAVNYPTTRAERACLVIPKAALAYRTEGRVYRRALLSAEGRSVFASPRETGPLGLQNFNTRRVHRLELPWGNGIASARGLCRVYAALAAGGELDGVRLVREATLRPVFARQSWAWRDRVLQKPVGWSQGFIKEETRLFSPNPGSFGHPGAGGALGFCDPARQLAIAYVPNKMSHHIRSPRAVALCHAVYRSLEQVS